MSKLFLDLSDFQESINWDDIANNGVEGIIIKINEGGTLMDCYNDFIDKCDQLGIPWGAYCFTHATTTDRAKYEAQVLLDALNGRTPQLGVWYDIESQESLDADATALCSAFICTINEVGIPCGIYASSLNFCDSCINPRALDAYVQYWVADYRGYCQFVNDYPEYLLAGWQYSDKGDIGCDGVSCHSVDLNEWYL